MNPAVIHLRKIEQVAKVRNTERGALMILKGNEDLRVVKTIEGIKSAFEELICEKEYGKITVKELCDRARINKKTFYHYYETLDALLFELKTEYSDSFVEKIKGYELPDELEKVNRAFFEYSAQQGLAYEKITCSGTYRLTAPDSSVKDNEAGWVKSKRYQALSDYEKNLLMGFVSSAVLTAYRKWIEEEKRVPLEEVIKVTNKIILYGVQGFLE